jgi:hypothetical protein
MAEVEHEPSDALAREYFALVDIVKEFDRNLLTVKGWAATVSIAALGLGFKEGHYGIFLVALLGGFSFWTIDAALKLHQMRYYLRMREIEVITAGSRPTGSPLQIDWTWSIAPDYFLGKREGPPPPPTRYTRQRLPYLFWLLPHVALPHAIAVVAGAGLFKLGADGSLGFPI